MNNIIFIAPPAAGKGTISDYLIKNYGYNHLSTGDLLREVIATQSPLGQEIDLLIKEGKLVSDDLILKLVEAKLTSLTLKPFIFDGFPRTLNQAQELDKMLVTHNLTNNQVIYLDINLEEALKRVLGRMVCSQCGRSYNLNVANLRPLNGNECDDCHLPLTHRSDDNEATFKVRFQTYLDNTKPILEYYEKQGKLSRINANENLAEILNKIIKLVNSNFNNKEEAKND